VFRFDDAQGATPQHDNAFSSERFPRFDVSHQNVAKAGLEDFEIMFTPLSVHLEIDQGI